MGRLKGAEQVAEQKEHPLRGVFLLFLRYTREKRGTLFLVFLLFLRA
jgi:hypothetical protein